MEKITHSYFSYDDKKGEEWKCNGLLHREDGPARIYTNGTKQYFYHGVLHRENGPAIEANHTYCWKYVYYKYGKIHNDKGPAYIEKWKDCEVLKYFQNNILHHIQGPAHLIKYCNHGNKKVENNYYINGTYFSQEQFEKIIKIIKKFCQKCKQKVRSKLAKNIVSNSPICYDVSNIIASYII